MRILNYFTALGLILSGILGWSGQAEGREEVKVDADGKSFVLAPPFNSAHLKLLHSVVLANQTVHFFTGRSCANCPDELNAIFMAATPFKNWVRVTAPGTIWDHKKNRSVFEGRFYYGDCHFSSPNSDGFVVAQLYQNELLDRRGFQRSVVEVRVMNDGQLKDRLIEAHLPNEARVKPKPKSERCFVGPAQKRDVLSAKFDLLPKEVMDDEVDLNEIKNGEKSEPKADEKSLEAEIKNAEKAK